MDVFVLSNTNISAISQPITIKFYQKHYWGGGQVALGFVLGRKRTLVSMATDNSYRLTMGKHKKNLLRNFKAQSFHILCVAMYSGPFYKSCQPCPWGSYRPRPGGIMGKTKKSIVLRHHKAQSFHMLYLAMYSRPLYKSCQPCPWGKNGPAPGCH